MNLIPFVETAMGLLNFKVRERNVTTKLVFYLFPKENFCSQF